VESVDSVQLAAQRHSDATVLLAKLLNECAGRVGDRADAAALKRQQATARALRRLHGPRAPQRRQL
jgi:hypothetical protein